MVQQTSSLSLKSLRPACSPCMWGFLIPKLRTSRQSTTDFLCLLPLFLCGLLGAHLPAYLLPPFRSDPQDQAHVPSSSVLAPSLCSYQSPMPIPISGQTCLFAAPTHGVPYPSHIDSKTSSTTSSSSERTPLHPNPHLYPWNGSPTPGILTHSLPDAASILEDLAHLLLTDSGAQPHTFLFQG